MNCKGLLKWLTLLLVLPFLGACINNDGGVASFSANMANITRNAAGTMSNSYIGGIGVSFTLDGEKISTTRSGLQDMGWHLLTITVTRFESGTESAPVGGIAYTIGTPNNPESRGEQVQVQDINCNEAVFSRVGDSCSAYVQISYDYIDTGYRPCFTSVTFSPNNTVAIPASSVLINDNVSPQKRIGDYRVIHTVEEQYYTGSSISSANRILLMQNGSLRPIRITTITPLNDPKFTLIHRTTSGTNDPYYGHWSECSLDSNPVLNQVSQLPQLNSSCILVYQVAASFNQAVVESANIETNTSALARFPHDAGEYTLQATYENPVLSSWESTSCPEVNSIAYGNGEFVAIGSEGAYSADGINWQTTTLPGSDDWNAVTYGNGMFAAVGGGGNSTTGAYSTDGINWQTAILPVSEFGWGAVAYGKGVFVAVGNANSPVGAYSTDGINWESTSFPASLSYVSSVTYGNGVFVAVGGFNGGAYSIDGINWESSTLPAEQQWNSVTYGNSVFVAVGGNSNNNVGAYSTDGISWESSTLPSSYGYQSVAYGSGLFVAVGQEFASSNIGAYSVDGINWQATNLPESQQWNSIAYGNGTFIAGGSNDAGSNNEAVGNMEFNLTSFTVNSQSY